MPAGPAFLNPVAEGFLQELHTLRGISAKHGGIRGPSEKQLVVWGVWIQADDLLVGTLALLRHPVALQASWMALARCAWEGSLVLRWVGRRPDERMAAWKAYSAKQAGNWFMKGDTTSDMKLTPEEKAALDKTSGELARLAKGGGDYPRSIEVQATEVGMEMSYDRVYRPLNATSHWHYFKVKEQALGRDPCPEQSMSVVACHYWMMLVEIHRLLGLDDAEVIASKPCAAWAYLYPGGLAEPTPPVYPTR